MTDFRENITSCQLLQLHSAKLANLIAPILYQVTNALHSKELIELETKEEMFLMGVLTEYIKASKLISVLQRKVQGHLEPDKYLINICGVLKEQLQPPLVELANTISSGRLYFTFL